MLPYDADDTLSARRHASAIAAFRCWRCRFDKLLLLLAAIMIRFLPHFVRRFLRFAILPDAHFVAFRRLRFSLRAIDFRIISPMLLMLPPLIDALLSSPRR